MAADPHAFYRGIGVPVLRRRDRRARTTGSTSRAERIWIHGDLHVENFGTYLNSDGRLVFDVNDFDEAYVGRFTWDLQRFAASLALVGWQKALPEDDDPHADRPLRPGLPRRRSTTTRPPTTTTTSRSTSTTPSGPVQTRWSGRALQRRADLLDEHDRCCTRACGASPRTAAIRRLPKRERAGQGGRGVRRLPRDHPGVTSGSTASSSTTCATSSASPASASAAPACRRTTCWSRATARRSTTTWCCR